MLAAYCGQPNYSDMMTSFYKILRPKMNSTIQDFDHFITFLLLNLNSTVFDVNLFILKSIAITYYYKYIKHFINQINGLIPSVDIPIIDEP